MTGQHNESPTKPSQVRRTPLLLKLVIAIMTVIVLAGSAVGYRVYQLNIRAQAEQQEHEAKLRTIEEEMRRIRASGDQSDNEVEELVRMLLVSHTDAEREALTQRLEAAKAARAKLLDRRVSPPGDYPGKMRCLKADPTCPRSLSDQLDK